MALDFYTKIRVVGKEESVDRLESIANSEEWSFDNNKRTEAIEFQDWSGDTEISVLSKSDLPEDFIKAAYTQLSEADPEVELWCKYADENSDTYGVYFISKLGHKKETAYAGELPQREDFDDEGEWDEERMNHIDGIDDIQNDMLIDIQKGIKL